MNTTAKQKIVRLILFFAVTVCSLFVYAQNSKTNPGTKKKYTDFAYFFPDTALAAFVANKLNKKITDSITSKELAAISGDFDIGVQPVTDLKGIGYLTGIDSFHCYKNEVTEIPAEIGKLINLKYLDLNKAFELEKIPAEIGKLSQLKEIRLSLTAVKSIPHEIGNLAGLESLWLCCNALSEIPREVGKLKNLKELDIHSNKIKNIPDEICNLVSLSVFNISHCELEQIPDNIGNLKKLQRLNLSNNNLKHLPPTIKQLTSLTYLNIIDNFKLSEDYKKYLPPLLIGKIKN